jgi:uncharacterized membrane protein YjjP (DUF1212 family)
MPETRRLDAAGHVLLFLARLLLEAGADSEHVRRRVAALAERLGFAAQLFLGSERLLLMVASGGTYRTRVGHAVGTMGIDAGRLFALETVSDALAAGKLDAEAADARLQAIERQASAYPSGLVILAVATTAAALARLFGASGPVVGASFLAGLVSLLVRRGLDRLGIAPAAIAASTAATSGAVAVLPLHILNEDPSLALVAAGMILVPGVPLINGVRDLIEGHSSIGLARLADALVIVLGIASGLAVASMAWGVRFPVDLYSESPALPLDVALSGLAALGFAILFNAPRSVIPAIILCGALAHGMRTAVLGLSGDLVFATLLGAFVAALIAMLIARRLRAPWTAFAFPGVVAMVPGSYAFRGMIGALDIMHAGGSSSTALIGASLAALVTAGALTAAIGIGLLVAAALYPPMSRAKGGVVKASQAGRP